jgi:hypothetical protein
VNYAFSPNFSKTKTPTLVKYTGRAPKEAEMGMDVSHPSKPKDFPYQDIPVDTVAQISPFVGVRYPNGQ